MIIKFIEIELIVISFLDVTALLAHFVLLLLLVVMLGVRRSVLLTWVSQSLFVMAVDGMGQRMDGVLSSIIAKRKNQNC